VLTALALVACGNVARADQLPADTAPPAKPAFKRHSVVALPAVFYSPETRLGGGAAAMHAFRGSSDARPITNGAILFYTQNRQVTAGVSTDAWLDGARHHVTASVGYSRFPNKFYGIGNMTPASDSESYTPRAFAMEAAAERRVARGIYLGVGGEFADGRLVETEAGGTLATGSIRGSDGGRVSGLGLTLSYDTRDNVVAAERGSYARVSARRYATFLASDYDFTSLRLDVRHYDTFAGHHVIATQASWSAASGEVPFDRLPKLGGQNLLRGYFEGRYRDRQYVAAQAEYRTPTWRRVGLAAFAGAGEVAPRFGALTLDGLHAAAGAGLRVLLSRQERLALRLDFGAGGGSSGMYVTVGEAF
jgi:outer membrane protein assembly factor BamA